MMPAASRERRAVAGGVAVDGIRAVSVTTRFSEHALEIVPGTEAILDVVVRNSGRVVDEFTIHVLGEAAGWAEVGPAQIRLMPGEEAIAQVVFRPPRVSSTAPRTIPIGIHVESREDGTGGIVEEGTLTVAPFSETAAELIPTTSHGRRRAVHELALDNRGNVGVSADARLLGADGELTATIRPPVLSAAPGNASFGRLVVRPHKTFWRGPARRVPFRLSVQADGQAPIILDGAMVQEALLPRWAPAVAVAAVALLLAGALVWALALRPAIRSAARDAAQSAVAQPLAAQTQATDRQAQQIKQLQQQAAGAAPPPTASPAAPAGDQVDGRLTGAAGVVHVKDGQTLAVTDVVFENPNGDKGLVRLQRVGAGGGPTTDLMVLKLDNFRDIDYHFVTPILVGPRQALQLNLPAGSGASVYYTGSLRAGT
jgi:hypothetical protein